MKKPSKRESAKKAKPKQIEPADKASRLFDDLVRYDQFRESSDPVHLLSGQVPLDFSLQFNRIPVGKCHLEPKELLGFFIYLVIGEDKEFRALSMSGATLESEDMRQFMIANNKRFVPFFLTVSYMLRHLPKKLDNALMELFLEAREYRLQQEARRNRKQIANPKKRAAEIRKLEANLMQERLHSDDLENAVAVAIGKGHITKDAAADYLGRSPRTLQRWANKNFVDGWKEAVDKYSSEDLRETKT
jgi:hypothetical protein